jgi:hypothetical protein
MWHGFVHELRERVAIFSAPYIELSPYGKCPILLHLAFDDRVSSDKFGDEHIVVLHPMKTFDQPQILREEERSPAIHIPQLDSFVQNEMWFGKIDTQKESKMSYPEVGQPTLTQSMVLTN